MINHKFFFLHLTQTSRIRSTILFCLTTN